MMTEKLFQFIWQNGYFNQTDLQTTAGEAIRIISKGSLNNNQGPDFLSSLIYIDGMMLAGSVELHLKTSDWEKHQHGSDENYRNVILHVVYQHDKIVDDKVPVLELQTHIPTMLLSRYEMLMNAPDSIACVNNISEVSDLVWTSWKERLVIERLTARSSQVFEWLKQSNGHWEEVLWWMLARNFGIKVNTDAFELIARSLPLKLIAKHKPSIHQLEALLFGQANLLGGEFKESYPLLLKREYGFLKKKYGLIPAFAAVHFLRMRPANFPTVRLAQLAMLLQNSSQLFSTVIEENELTSLKKLLQVTANDYWHYHYRFEEICAFQPKKLGEMMINNLIINTIVPIIFAYGFYHKNEMLQTKALKWLEEMAAEDNRIVEIFKTVDVKVTTAFDSQSLVELKKEYCDCKRCLECGVGASILKIP
jgi:hypothetical protein